MSKELPIIYISLTGNTHNFVTRLKDHLRFLEPSLNVTLTNVKDLVKGKEDYFKVGKPFVAFLPTYLEGGNGLDNGDVEILTNDLGDFIAFEENYKRCFGIVGSGNRNFNHQYCLTAKQYSERFGFPVLDTFELRGLNEDIKRIGLKIEELYGL